MKKIMTAAFAVFVSLSLLTGQSFPCTTFCLKNGGEVLFGKNYDWMIGDGFVFVNKRGVQKTSMAGANAARWTSRYGSLTFNQYGRENPMGGMNEAGLVVELMWLDETKYPSADARPALDTLEWIQYQLDTAQSVAEVIKNSETVRIESRVTLHYLIADRDGNSATIEFLNGRLVARTGENLPVAALANDTYEKSLNYARATQALGGTRPTPQTAGSLERFTRAAQKTKEFEKSARAEKDAVNYAFDVLRDVAQNGSTQWSIVYDQKRAQIHFRSRQSPAVKTIDAGMFDYACGSAVKMLDINFEKAGDATKAFTDYDAKANRELIERSFAGTDFLRQVPGVMKDSIAKHGESFACAADGGGSTVISKPSKERFAASATDLWAGFIPVYAVYVLAKTFFAG